MKKNIVLIIISLLCAGLLYSQNVSITKTGTTAASFLKIGVGARTIGMGGAFTAVANDLSAIYWNPAGLGRLPTSQVSFNHIDWIAGVKYDNAAAAIAVGEIGTIGLSFTTMNVGDMEVTTTDMPEGTGEMFSAGGTLIGLSYAKNLTDKFSIGFNVKYVREDIWNMRAQTIALDIGTLYTADILNGVNIGADMSNFGTKMRMVGRDNRVLIKTGAGGQNIVNAEYELGSYDLPLIFRVGLATDILRSENNRMTVAVDAIHPNDNTEYVNSGLEYTWANIVSLRAGWKSAYERGSEQGLTFGGGIEYSLASQMDFVLDYAYMDFGRLKPVHYFSFGLKF